MAAKPVNWQAADIERFNDFVSRPRGKKVCHLWNGALNEKGYGIFRMAWGVLRAHRVAFCIHHDLPLKFIKGVDIHHTCENKSCVRAEHLVARDKKGHTIHHSTLRARSQREVGRKFKQR